MNSCAASFEWNPGTKVFSMPLAFLPENTAGERISPVGNGRNQKKKQSSGAVLCDRAKENLPCIRKRRSGWKGRLGRRMCGTAPTTLLGTRLDQKVEAFNEKYKRRHGIICGSWNAVT